MKLLIRIPGQGTDFTIDDISDTTTVEELKRQIEDKHPKKPKIESQRLISGGKLLQNDQLISDLKLPADSQIIHLVISEPPSEPVTTPVVPVVEPEIHPEPVEEIPVGEPVVLSEPTILPENDTSWLTPELKQYFDTWDLSIRCYELSETHNYLAPRLKILKALIMANQKQIKTGIPIVPDNVDIDGNVDNLPRQNAERDNAVVGAQGQIEDDGPQDWLDRFYSIFRVSLMLFIVYNYSSTERFMAAVVIGLSIILYQAGIFQVRRRPRPPTPAATDADGNPAPVEAPRPGIFRMLWIFLSQFIASLIPQNPQAVNAN